MDPRPTDLHKRTARVCRALLYSPNRAIFYQTYPDLLTVHAPKWRSDDWGTHPSSNPLSCLTHGYPPARCRRFYVLLALRLSWTSRSPSDMGEEGPGGALASVAARRSKAAVGDGRRRAVWKGRGGRGKRPTLASDGAQDSGGSRVKQDLRQVLYALRFSSFGRPFLVVARRCWGWRRRQ